MKRKGFSLIEILVYTAIIGIIGTLLNGILISLLKIQNRQTASTEVNQQINFVLLNIQRLVRQSVLIDMATNTPTSTLTLRMADPAKDPTLIYKTGTAIYLKEGASSEVLLTTGDVNADDLQFTKIYSATNYASVQFTISLSYNTQNPQRAYSKTITSAVAHPNPQ